MGSYKGSDLVKLMSPTLKKKVETMTPLQRKYAEYRARGLSKADSAQKAGSEAGTRAALSRIGYQMEENEDNGVAEYIMFLQTQRARYFVVEESEVIEMLREVYRNSMESGKFNEANKAAELLGSYIGMFGKNAGKQTQEGNNGNSTTTNNVNAFKDEGENVQGRIKKFGHLLKDLEKH